MKNTFTGAVTTFQNRGLHAVIAETMTFRKQLFLRSEFVSQTGWDDQLNDFMKDWLEKLHQTIARVTYSPSSTNPDETKETRTTEAQDVTVTLASTWDGKSVNSDDVVMPAMYAEPELPYDWTGSHKDFPQPTVDRVKNDFARMFISGLDYFVVACTNCDSRTAPATINKMEAAQLRALLNELYTICMTKGGDANRAEVPTGLAASEQNSTFNATGEFDPKDSTTS